MGNDATLDMLSLAAIVMPIASTLHAQTSKPAQPVNIERVKGDLYMISGEGGNVAVYVTGAGRDSRGRHVLPER